MSTQKARKHKRNTQRVTAKGRKPGRRSSSAPKWHDKFLAKLREFGNVQEACDHANIGRTAAYAHRRKDEKFATAWDEAVTVAVDRMEREAMRRAVEGVPEPVFYQGTPVGAIRRYSDRLMEMLLRAHRPEKYRETTRTELSGPDGRPVQTESQVVLYLPDNGRKKREDRDG